MINKRFQIALIAKFLLVNAFVLALFGIFIYTFFNSEIEANLYSAHVTYSNMKDMVLPIIFTLSIINILISSVIITIFVLYTSFRIAGPLYRFNAAIQQINKGNLDPMLHLREKDELYAFSETLQEFTEYLSEVSARSQEIALDLKAINKELKDERLEKNIEALESLMDRMKQD